MGLEPPRDPKLLRLPGKAVELALYEWPGRGPGLFFAHATGFHGRCWDRVVARLPGLRCLAIDMRGHGLSAKPSPPYDWRDFGRDVAAVGTALGLSGAIAVGHSKGGHAVTVAAALEPGLFAGLLLIDPVIVPPAAYETPVDRGEHFAARRRNQWSSPAEMFESFRGRPPFDRWDPDVLRDYCEFGLLPAEDGGFELACPPAIEAAVYAGGSRSNIYPEIESLDISVRVLRGRQRSGFASVDMGSSPTNPDLARHFPRGEDLHLPEATHFIPMESPALVAQEVEAFARRLWTGANSPFTGT